MEPGALDDVLASARQGDEGALAQLYRSLQPPLLRYLRRQAHAVAEDLASETWLAVARQLPSFTGTIDDFRALLFTIARRRVADHYRAVGRRPVLEQRQVDVTEAGSDPGVLVVDELSAQQAIERLVGSLPAAQAEVVLLRVLAGLSVEEVARTLDRSAGAVRILQHRALRNLAKQFSEEGRDTVTDGPIRPGA